MALWFFVLQCWYLMLPGLLSNLVPPLVKKIPFLDYPIDLGLKFRRDDIFGTHKTFRGFFFGITTAILVVFLQSWLWVNFAAFKDLSIIDYSSYSALALGILMGFGALFGDAVKSFFKRRIHVKPGKPWFPFDQIDFIIGWLLFTLIVYVPSWQVILTLFLTVPLIHIATNHIGFYIGINKEKW